MTVMPAQAADADDARRDGSGTVTSAAGRRPLLTDNALVLAAGVQLVAGVVTSKLAATLLGAAGVGTFALVQAVANIVALCALGTGEALVREWGRRTESNDPPDFDAMLRGAELASLTAMGIVAAVALTFSRPLARLIFGDGSNGGELFLLAVAAGITFGWVTLQVNSMVARRRIRRVGLALALAAGSTPVVAWLGFSRWGVDGISRVQLLAMLASLVTTGAVTIARPSAATTPTDTPPPPPVRAALAEVPALLRYGVPQVLGFLFTAAMLLIVPLVVASGQGVDAAGYYRAAATIAAGMATLFTFELNGDFSARIAAASTDDADFAATMGAHLRRLCLRGIIVVGALSVAAPIIVPVLYDRSFDPTTTILPLILVGQLLGLVAITLNIGVGARHGGGPMLANAAIGGTATVTAVALTDSLAAVGLAFVAGQAVFLAVCVASTVVRDGVKPLASVTSRELAS